MDNTARPVEDPEPLEWGGAPVRIEFGNNLNGWREALLPLGKDNTLRLYAEQEVLHLVPEALRAAICGLREAQAGPVSTGHWYCVDITGRAMLCADRADAEAEAAKLDAAYQRFGPHRAVKLYTAPPTSAAADAPAQGVLRNFEITGPDGDGLVWLVLRGHGTSGSAMFNLGAANRLAAQVALKLEEDRRAALAASAQTEVGR